MKKNLRICPRCKGSNIISHGKKVFECDECGNIFKEFDNTEDIMIKLTEFKDSGDITDILLYEAMSEGVAHTGRLRTFGHGKLHIYLESVSSNEVSLVFCYRDASLNRREMLQKGSPLDFSEGGYRYSIAICAEENESGILKRLKKMRDEEYREFNMRLIPTVSPDTVIGVRVPDIRVYAKELCSEGKQEAFLAELPHKYHEENLLHVAIICEMAEIDRALSETENFLQYVDNWAICDALNPKVFSVYPGKLMQRIEKWIKSEHPYTVRFAVGMLMTHFLDDNFKPEYLKTVSELKTEHYYVKMEIAWYFATALAKHPDAAWKYFEQGVLDGETRKMAVRKVKDSRRIPKEIKDKL